VKNAFKMFGIIAIAALIGFWSVSCGDDNDSGGGNAISGNTITSGAEVVYDSYIEDVAEAKKVTDFGFRGYWDENNDTEEYKPLSYFFDGSSSVKISNGKVTINLGTPKSAYLQTINGMFKEGVTVNPINAKICQIYGFTSFDGKYDLYCPIDYNKQVEVQVILVYADRNVTVKGSSTYSDKEDEQHTDINNVSLKKGWNYLISSYNETTKTCTYTSSTTLPSGPKWTVYENNYYY